MFSIIPESDLFFKRFESIHSDGIVIDRSSLDRSMSQLHSLLIREPPTNLQRTQSHTLAQKQYCHRAKQIFSQGNDAKSVFPFLALPAELRVLVYLELLTTDDRLVVTWRGPRKATKQQKLMFINILLTCKLCLDEGRRVLYGKNVFDFEEICNRPLGFAKTFLKRIGSHNASMVRIIVAEYSAAAEELSTIHREKATQITLYALEQSLSAFSIKVSDLRVFAISIVPYGFDPATIDLIKLHASGVMPTMPLTLEWIDDRNDSMRLANLVESICSREQGLVEADYRKDIDAWISFPWSPPFSGRKWIVYNGVKRRQA